MLKGYIIEYKIGKTNNFAIQIARTQEDAIRGIIGGANIPISKRIKDLGVIIKKVKIVRLIQSARYTISNGHSWSKAKNVVISDGHVQWGFSKLRTFKVLRRGSRIHCFFKDKNPLENGKDIVKKVTFEINHVIEEEEVEHG